MLNELQDYELRKEFLSQIKRAQKIIFESTQCKKFQGAFVDGEKLIELARAYVESVNVGRMPNIQQAWEYIKESHNQKILEELANEIKDRAIS